MRKKVLPMSLEKNFFIAGAVCFSVMGTTVFAAAQQDTQCFTRDHLITLNKQDVAGGQGTLYGKFSFTRDMAAPDQAIKEIGWMTLKPGASIGTHKHQNNEDSYVIISGQGTFTDGTGKSTLVGPGDITIARPGQSHGLSNTGKDDLVFLDIIAQNDGEATKAVIAALQKQ
jgi:mannose-6-phosphate isomerase-like protein (cupin superfamily)